MTEDDTIFADHASYHIQQLLHGFPHHREEYCGATSGSVSAGNVSDVESHVSVDWHEIGGAVKFTLGRPSLRAPGRRESISWIPDGWDEFMSIAHAFLRCDQAGGI